MGPDDIQPGQILLVEPSEWVGEQIVGYENLWHPPDRQRNFSHAAAVLNSPTGLEIVESTLPRARQIMLPTWLAEQTGKVHVAVPWDRWVWTPECDMRAWAFAFPFLDQGYNWPAIPVMAIWEALGQTTPPVPQTGGMVCSVLAVAVIQAGMGLKCGDKGWRNPLAIDPNTIPELPWVSETVELTMPEAA